LDIEKKGGICGSGNGVGGGDEWGINYLQPKDKKYEV